MSNSSRSWASSARPKKISMSTTASIEATPREERQAVRQRSSANLRRYMGSEYRAFDLRKYLRRQRQTRTLEHLPVLPRGTRQSRKRLLAMLQAKGDVAHDQPTECLVELRKTLRLRHQIVFQALHVQPIMYRQRESAVPVPPGSPPVILRHRHERERSAFPRPTYPSARSRARRLRSRLPRGP